MSEHGPVLEFRDLIEIEFRSNNLKQYMLGLESIITRMNTLLTYDILEALFRRQLEKAEHLKGMLDLYWLGITQEGEPKDYHRVACMVKAHLEDRRHKKNRCEHSQGGARKPRPASPAPARGGTTSPGKKGI